MTNKINELDHIILGALLRNIDKFLKHAHIEDLVNTKDFCNTLKNHLVILCQETRWIDLALGFDDPLNALIEASVKFAHAEHEPKTSHQNSHLVSLLSRVTLNKNQDRKDEYYHELVELNLENIYPISDLKETSSPSDYQKLGETFKAHIKNLPTPSQVNPSTLRAVVYNLLTLFERFFVNVPAETDSHYYPDISLFDQLRMSAAIAEGLYRHHTGKQNLEQQDFFDDKTEKWRLVCGDFSGIQAFIYNITQRAALKGLRGRSLYIQLLCDSVCHFLIQQLGLYPTARIYSSGGKFYLLIADCQEDLLYQHVNEVNEWLFKEFRGKVFLGIGMAKVCGENFSQGKMSDKWKEANEDLQKNRLTRFFPMIQKNTQEFFSPQHTQKGERCQVCGRDDDETQYVPDKDEGGNPWRVCKQCFTLKQLGKKLAEARLSDIKYFLWLRQEDAETFQKSLPKEEAFEIFRYQLYLLKEFPSKVHPCNATLEKLNSANCFGGNSECDGQYGFRFLAKWDLAKDSWDWDLDEFSKESQGIKRLGILRMDVDNLGQVFIRGVRLASLSRVATLSRQLNLFFSGHLNTLLKDYPRTQIIYAGGDDLFLIGSWDQLPQVAWHIREQFRRYCAYNPDLTLSGGIAMVDSRYPISMAAELAGKAEEEAKNLNYSQEKTKDAFCFIDTPFPWEMYETVECVNELITCIIQRTGGYRSIIDRLRAVIIGLQEAENEILERQKMKGHGGTKQQRKELAKWHQWRWRLIYNLARMAQQYPQAQEALQELQDILLIPI